MTTTPMTAAEYRAWREHLGLSAETAARLLRVSERQARRWEQGTAPIPAGVRDDVTALAVATDDVVADLVATHPQDTALVTYPDDDAYLAAHPGGPWDARWHRAVAVRVARARDDVHLTY